MEDTDGGDTTPPANISKVMQFRSPPVANKVGHVYLVLMPREVKDLIQG